MQAPGQSPSYWLGQGTDPSITDTCHSKSCLCCGSLFVASSAIPDRKRTTDDPNAHFPRLSFRTSFSFSPFGFSSVSFVTRYQPVAQSLFHTLSHQVRLGGTCHWVAESTRENTHLLLNVYQPAGRRVCLFHAVRRRPRRTPPWNLLSIPYDTYPISHIPHPLRRPARGHVHVRHRVSMWAFHLPLSATALPTTCLPQCGRNAALWYISSDPPCQACPPQPAVQRGDCPRSGARGQLELDPCPGFHRPTVTSPKLRNVLIGNFNGRRESQFISGW